MNFKNFIMKRLILLCSFMCLGFVFSYAQEINEGAKGMSQGQNNAFTVLLKLTEKKTIQKAWEKYIKKFDGKTKLNKKTGEIFSNDSELENMSANTVDVYATVNQKGTGTELTVWFDLGGAYLSSEAHSDKVAVAETLINDFALSVSRAAIEEELKEEEKNLKKVNKDLDILKKDKKNFEDEIEKCKKKIAEAEQGIEENIKAQSDKEDEIKEQEKVVEKVKEKLSKIDD